MSLFPGFVPTSTFVSRWDLLYGSKNGRPLTCRPTRHVRVPGMVAQKPSKREELERLSKQLAELQALRAKLAKKQSSNKAAANEPPGASTSSPTPAASSKKSSASKPADPAGSENTSTITFGKSSQGSRFLCVSSVDSEEFYPRIVLIAGSLPDLSTADFMKTPSALYSKNPVQGNLFLSRLPDGYDGNMVAIPGTEVLTKCGDPVVVLVPPTILSETKLPATPGDDVVVIVDRAMDEPFDSYAFYAWDVKGKVSIGWLKEDPPAEEATRIGKVVYGIIEIDESLREKKTCWEEENETYQ